MQARNIGVYVLFYVTVMQAVMYKRMHTPYYINRNTKRPQGFGGLRAAGRLGWSFTLSRIALFRTALFCAVLHTFTPYMYSIAIALPYVYAVLTLLADIYTYANITAIIPLTYRHYSSL